MVVGVFALGTTLASAGAGEFSRIEADVSALPEANRFVGRLVAERVGERVPPSDAAGVFKVRFALDPKMAEDTAAVRVKGAEAEVRAPRFRTLISGAGRLLKSFRYRRDRFEAADGSYDFKAAKSVRIAYLARHFASPYMQLDAPFMCRYIDDLVLDGINAFNTQTTVPGVDAVRLKHDTAERDRFLAVSKEIVAHLRTLDCGTTGGGGGNQAAGDTDPAIRSEKNTNPRVPETGFNVCPSKPAGKKFLMDRQRRSLERMKDRGLDIRFLTHFPYDEGGCGCAKCRPWGCNGYIRMCEDFHPLNKAAFPDAKEIMSTWFFEEKEFAGLWEYLKTHDWIDYLEIDDFGSDYPQYPLDHPIPNSHTKIITFPEISMWGRIPWGGFGAVAYPKMLERIFRKCEKAVEGFRYYSEGLFEDINKAVVTELYIDPSTTSSDILARYAAYHFPGVDPADFLRLVDLFEKNHRPYMMESASADAAKTLALKMDGEILPTMKGSWRWRLVYLRAMIDPEICGTEDLQPDSARPYFDELVKIYHVEKQLDQHLEGRMACFTCPKYIPDGRSPLVRRPPAGDATEYLQKLVDGKVGLEVNSKPFVNVRLGKGDWRIGCVDLRKSCFEVVLEDGCRLVGEPGAALRVKGVDGLTVRGEGKAEVLVPVEIRDSKNVVFRNVALGPDGARIVNCEDTLVDLGKKDGEPVVVDPHAEMKKLDIDVEWADEHLQKERLERLNRRLQQLRIMNRAR